MSNRKLTCLTLALGLGATACAEDGDGGTPSIDQLEQGITILDADPAAGVAGAYRDGDDVVYFETRVGYMKPEIYRQAYPDEPAAEMDMRFVDRNGLTFYLMRGGDQLVDPTWGQSFDASFHTYVTDEARARDFALAQAAGRAFPEVAEPALAEHTFHMRAYGQRLTPAEDPLMTAQAAAIEGERPEVAYGQWEGTGWWYLQGDMYTKSVALIGSHGGVAYWAYDTSWKLQAQAYNHSDWSNMAYRCSTTGGWKQNPTFYYEGAQGTGSVTGGCTTGYNATGIFSSGTHNSNDDTAYELWQVKEGSWSTSRGNWSNFSWDGYQCSSGSKWTAPSYCP